MSGGKHDLAELNANLAELSFAEIVIRLLKATYRAAKEGRAFRAGVERSGLRFRVAIEETGDTEVSNKTTVEDDLPEMGEPARSAALVSVTRKNKERELEILSSMIAQAKGALFDQNQAYGVGGVGSILDTILKLYKLRDTIEKRD